MFTNKLGGPLATWLNAPKHTYTKHTQTQNTNKERYKVCRWVPTYFIPFFDNSTFELNFGHFGHWTFCNL